MRLAVCPGSFDPVTKGHLDIIRRAAGLFDAIIVLVSINPAKKTVFTADERVEMIKTVTKDIPHIMVDQFNGLLMDYVKEHKAVAVVKGLRAVSDFEYEFQLSLVNKKIYPQAETVFLNTNAENMFLSSSLVKQMAGFGADISDYVPAELCDIISKKLYINNIQ